MHLISLVPGLDSVDNEQEPVIKHECLVIPEKDEVEKLIPGNSMFARFDRWFTRQRILSPTHFYARTYLKSSTNIKNEIKMHLQKFPHMIHPFSPLRDFWDKMMIIFTMGALMLTPIFNTFFFNETNPMPGNLIFDFAFMLDIIVRFFTGYYDLSLRKVNLNPKIVFIDYVTGYFFLDLLTAIPVELFDSFVHTPTTVEWYSFAFNFVKIFRIRNLSTYLHNLHRTYQIPFQANKIMELIIILVIFMNWATCLVYYVPLVVLTVDPSKENDENATKSWILNESMLKRDTNIKKYILCLNRATISLVSSDHYLEVQTAEDMIINLTLAIIGKIGFIYLLSQVFQLVSTTHSSDKERLRILQQLQEYMQYKELPRVMQKRLLVYCNYWYKKNFNRDKHILAEVSEPLREELIYHNSRTLLETVPFFKQLPRPAISKLLTFIKPEIYLSSDVIVKSGISGDSMYFIVSGTVAVYTAYGKEICHLEDGAYFGEIALVMENEQRVANVIAIETCEILKISRDAFLQVVEPFPNLLSHLQKIAFEQLANTVPLDEVYNLDDLSTFQNYVNISNISVKKKI